MLNRAFIGTIALLVLLGPAAHAALAQDAPTGIALTAGDAYKRRKSKLESGHLYRELLRQAVLIAARDGLGLSTRDLALREAMPAEASGPIKKLIIETDVRPGEYATLTLKDGDKKIYEYRLPLKLEQDERGREVPQTQALIQGTEQASRGEFIEALKKAGFNGKAHPTSGDVAVPVEVAAQLAEMNFLSQFSAVRELHEVQKTQGESHQTLAALARAYAHLGQLTYFHWNATHKVFRARALLYANRLVSSAPDSAWALWNRGYVNALVGLHADALADLAAGNQANTGAEKPLETPAWVPLAEAYCRFDYEAIAKGFDQPDVRELAALLSYLAVENSGCESLILTKGDKALDLIPECYAIIESMGVRCGGVGNLHRTTVAGATSLARALPVRFGQLRGAPSAAKAALQPLADAGGRVEFGDGDPNWADPIGRKELVAALVEAGATDTAEPSWEALGRMIEDLTLVHAVRRLLFLTDTLALPPDSYRDEVDQALEICSEHPYVGLIRFASTRVRNEQAKTLRALADVPLVDVDMSLYTLVNRGGNIPTSLGVVARQLELLRRIPKRHSDTIACDREYTVRLGFKDDLSQISPLSPVAIAFTVENAPAAEMTPERLQKIEQENARHAAVQRALAKRYESDKDAESAARCYERYLALSPDQGGYKRLAQLYLDQGDRTRWQATLEESLSHPDFGLSHARSQVMIADYLMSEEKFQEARPFALAAAGTGAAWAMMCAVRCHTGLEEWTAANELLSYLATRYDMGMDWYSWCKRTGHGDLPAAEKHMLGRSKELFQRAQVKDLDAAGVFYLTSGRDGLARTTLRRFFDRHESNWAGLLAAILADEAKAPGERDKLLAEIAVSHEKARTKPDYDAALSEPIYQTAAWMKQDYARAAEAKIDTAGLDASLNPDPQMSNYVLQAYLIGRYLKDRGENELAIKYLDRGLNSPHKDRLFYWLCGELKKSLLPPSNDKSSGNESSDAQPDAAAKPE